MTMDFIDMLSLTFDSSFSRLLSCVVSQVFSVGRHICSASSPHAASYVTRIDRSPTRINVGL
jgi:hypothetical protein